MATGAATAEVAEEGFGRELAGQTYRIMKVLSRGPQDERYLVTRFYGIGFPEKTAEELQAEMGLSPEEFEELRRRGVKRPREAQKGVGDGD